MEVPTLPATPSPPPEKSSGRRRQLQPQRGGAIWILIATAVPRLIGSVFTVALRRVLGPSASGAFDLSATPYRFLGGISNFGTGPALVYEQSVRDRKSTRLNS